MAEESLSGKAIMDATRSRAKFSGHGRSKGAAGYVSDTDDSSYDFLGTTGETAIFNPQEGGYERIRIGAAWQNIVVQEADQGLFGKLFKKVKEVKGEGVDLDLGCLYELQSGKRGCIQSFGELFGDFEKAPFIHLTGDDRTGDDDDDDDGEDEIMYVNGPHWPEIKRMLVYLYIYGGADNWAHVQPQVQIRVPNEKPMIVTLHTFESKFPICAVAGLENVRNGIKLTNFTEYYPGHAEMDRAFGYGIEWADGQKQ